MWSSDIDDPNAGFVEDWIRAAEQIPRPTAVFREQVLQQAVHARRRSESLQRVQVLTTLLIGAAVLFGLPGYYHGLRDDHQPPHSLAETVAAVPPQLSRIALAAMAVSQPLHATDDFEWNLVQAELTIKDQSARVFGAAL
jgi:hypothetical protein